ncbi:MAG: ATP synthase subunit I [candidate division Zixibacteria bacterium]|nr:ATP synthase subunit I [candidate division Zixibacteria bacterium]
MYPEVVEIMMSLLAGFVLGIFFFGILYWTTGRMAYSRFPIILSSGSLIVRFAAALSVFYLVSQLWGLVGILATLSAFMVTKYAFVRIVNPQKGLEVFQQ